MPNLEIMWTKVDEAPALATYSLLPIVKAFTEAAGISVVGVTQDDVASHKDFCNKFAFTIDLLADPGAGLMKALGIGQGEWQGMKYWERTSFVVDPHGKVRKVYEKVNPQGHEQVLLNDIKQLQQHT